MIEYSEDEPSGPMMDCEDEARHQAYLARERKKVDRRTGAKVVDLFEALKASLKSKPAPIREIALEESDTNERVRNDADERGGR